MITTPFKDPLFRISQLGRSVFDRAAEAHFDLVAAGVAFYAILAVFPASAAVVALWGFLSDPVVLAGQLDTLRPFVPTEALAILEGQAEALLSTGRTTLGWASALSLLLALWSTRTGIGALMRGLNLAFHTKPRRGLNGIVASFSMTMALVMVALIAMSSIVVAPLLMLLLPGDAPVGALRVVRWMITIVVILLMLSILYRYGPNHTGPRPTWFSPGTLVALGLWGIGSAGFTLYLGNFGSYNQVYGSIGAVIALLMWFFISAYSVLLGAALNAELLGEA